MIQESPDELMSGATASEQPRTTGEDVAPTATFRVLVPLDGSPLAAEALPVAASICVQIPDSECILMSALPFTPLSYGFMATPDYLPPELYQQLSDEQQQLAREYLESAAVEVSRRGVRNRIYMERGNTIDAILDAAASQHISLIVMTTHGRTGVARFAMGSVADKVVRGGSTPVLLLRSFQSQKWSDTTLRHVLIPLDGAPPSEAPLEGIVPQLAGSVIQHVTLLQAADPRDGAEAVSHAESYLAQAAQRLKERLGDKTCAIQTLVRSGPVAPTIIDCTAASGCGVVIMSTRGEAGIGRLAFGGVTDRVLRDGQTPLLLVYPRENPSA